MRTASMHTLKLVIAYDGTRYGGWQTQRGPQAKTPSIQSTIEAALQRVTQEPARVTGSGRTDAGVHAAGQAAHCRLRRRVDLARLQRSLNSLLPADIAIRSLSRAPADFHARYGARRKRYRYQIWNSPVRDPQRHAFVHQVAVPLDVPAMRRAARPLVGRHDFRRFQAAGRPVRSAVRTIHRLTLRAAGPLITIEVEADGFLYKMVRLIAGTLIEVGRGRWQAASVRELLHAKRPLIAAVTAPARGLCLLHVTYGRAVVHRRSNDHLSA